MRDEAVGMRTFLIQTVQGQIKHDFSFQLFEAIEYHNWLNGKKSFEIILTDEARSLEPEIIPVGSLEFVFKCLGFKPRPINIPDVLMQERFLKRTCYYSDKKDIRLDRPMFVKSADIYKAFTEIVRDLGRVPDGKYLVSEAIDIDSEWRAFVFRGELVGLNNYCGDFTRFPDIGLIKEMIKEYENSPGAFTLDIGINESGTFIIEVHPFVSCGLYGFSDLKILPAMFILGFIWFCHTAATLN